MNVQLWEVFEYDDNEQLPALINLTCIKGHLGRSVVSVGDSNTKVWCTMGINKSIYSSRFLAQSTDKHL
jgi:hypothetical protein